MRLASDDSRREKTCAAATTTEREISRFSLSLYPVSPAAPVKERERLEGPKSEMVQSELMELVIGAHAAQKSDLCKYKFCAIN